MKSTSRVQSGSSTYRNKRKNVPHVEESIPPLVNGDKLDAEEFLRRYEAMPEMRKAELLDGIVFIMSSPISTQKHGEPDMLMHTLLGVYGIHTTGVRASGESTAMLKGKSIPQPDASLRYLPERNGNSKLDAKGYLVGSPELVVEISASSASVDTHMKFEIYQNAGVREYIVVLPVVPAVNWWVLEGKRYQALAADDDGILRSRAFPGLWLDPKALLKGDGKRLMAVLRKGLKSKEHAAFAKLVS